MNEKPKANMVMIPKYPGETDAEYADRKGRMLAALEDSVAQATSGDPAALLSAPPKVEVLA